MRDNLKFIGVNTSYEFICTMEYCLLEKLKTKELQKWRINLNLRLSVTNQDKYFFLKYNLKMFYHNYKDKFDFA